MVYVWRKLGYGRSPAGPERFQVIRWTKKEAILEDMFGRRRRITPSEFVEYAPSLRAVFRHERHHLRNRITHLKEQLAKDLVALEKIELILRYTDLKEIADKRVDA